MATQKLVGSRTPTSKCPKDPITPNPPCSSLNDTPLVATSATHADKLHRSPATTERLKGYCVRILLRRLEVEWQNIIDRKAQTLGKAGFQVQFSPVADEDKDRIFAAAIEKPDMSLQEIMDTAVDSLLELWKGCAKRLIQEFKSVMGSNIVEAARFEARHAKVLALREAERTATVPKTPSKQKIPQATAQKYPDKLTPGAEATKVPGMATATSVRQRVETPRYELRARPVHKAVTDIRERVVTSTKLKRNTNAKAEGAATPTRGPKTAAARQPGTARRGKRQGEPAILTPGMRDLPIENNMKPLGILDEFLIGPLHLHLKAVSDTMNKEMGSLEGDTRMVESLQVESIVQLALRAVGSRSANKTSRMVISSICADVLLEWVSSHRYAIDVLSARGLKPIQDALLAVEKAKADFHSQTGLPSKQRRGGATPGRRRAKKTAPSAAEVVKSDVMANPRDSTTGYGDPEGAGSPSSHAAQLLHSDVDAPLPASRPPAQRQHADNPRVLPTDDPFIADPHPAPASQPVKPRGALPQGTASGDLRTAIFEARDAVLKKINTKRCGLEDPRPALGRQNTVSATYHAVVRRLTEDLAVLDLLRKREESIRDGFNGLLKVLSYIDMGEAEERAGSEDLRDARV